MSPSQTSREEEIFESPSGLLSLGGGKLTTYRRVAERVVDRVVERLRQQQPGRRFGPCRTATVPLPGADVRPAAGGGFRGFAKRVRTTPPGTLLDAALVRHVLHRYGTAAPEILAGLAADPRAAARIVEELPYRWTEVARAADVEMAATLDDALRRRVPIACRDRDAALPVADEVAKVMAPALGWDAHEQAIAVARYRAGVEAEQASRRAPRAADDLDERRRA